jgi:hypothetical protein
MKKKHDYKYRYVVERCDNTDSLMNPDGSLRERQTTWMVRDRETGAQVCDVDTRKQAREEASKLNREASGIRK